MASPYTSSGMPNTMTNMGPGAAMHYSSNGASPNYGSVQNGGSWQAVQGARFGQQTSFQSQNVAQSNALGSEGMYHQSGVSSSGGMMGQSTGLMSSSGAVYGQSPMNQYTSAQGYSSMTGGYNLKEGERVESTRKISSVVVGEEYLGALPNYDEVRYVEVPYIEEVIKHVPRREVVEVEKRVPKYEYEWVEKVVEIPQVQIVDKHVEVPQIQEIIRHVPRLQVIDVPREVLRHVPKIETKMVEKFVEVPGQLVEVPKPYTVENPVHITRYVDKECPLVVAQSMKPSIIEGQEHLDVDVFEYEPECVPVDVHVLKGVNAHIIASGSETMHKLITVPAAQYNTMLKSLNSHLGDMEVQKLPYLTEAGRIPFISDSTKFGIAPAQGAVIYDVMGQTRREFNVTVNGQVIGNSATYAPGSAQVLYPAQSNSYPNQQMNMMSQLQGHSGMMEHHQSGYTSNMMTGSPMLAGSTGLSRSNYGVSQQGASLSAMPQTARTTFSKEGSAHFAQSNSFQGVPMSVASTTILDQSTRQSQFGASAYSGASAYGNTNASLTPTSMGASYPMLGSSSLQKTSPMMGQSAYQNSSMVGRSSMQGTSMMGQSAYQGTNMDAGYSSQFGQSALTGGNSGYVSPSYMMENNQLHSSISPLA